MTVPARVICIAGPTGSGKTAAALHTARSLHQKGIRAVIINADSRQLYADFPVITAQPTPEERGQCPHLLYGCLPPDKKMSAGEWAGMAGAAIRDCLEKSAVPIAVGGTGFYMRALFDGITEIPAIDDGIKQQLAQELAESGSAALHARLRQIDPEYAAKIHPHDSQRCCRALEVWEGTGKTFTWWHGLTPPPPPWDILRIGIGLPLDELTPRLELRIHAMLELGAIDEARSALKQCPDTTTPGWSGIGCAELAAWLQGKLEYNECLRLWAKNTRAYAKRQWTWFRADKRILWFRPGEEHSAADAVLGFLGIPPSASGGSRA